MMHPKLILAEWLEEVGEKYLRDNPGTFGYGGYVFLSMTIRGKYYNEIRKVEAALDGEYEPRKVRTFL